MRTENRADRFVRVNPDGSIRELTQDEKDYLNTDFHGTDGARPYVKSRYDDRDGWGSIGGFLDRERVPQNIEVMPTPSTRNSS
jgi:hypothetical protein